MPIALAVTGIGHGNNQFQITVGLTFTGNYPTGGDTVDLTSIIGASDDVGVAVFSALPIYVDPALGGGFGGEFIPGSGLNNCKLKVFSAPGTELAAGGYAANAALLAASLNNTLSMTFDKLL